MEAQELMELPEKARGAQRNIGVSMAVFAAVLAMVTLMGHRLHTDEVVLQTKAADGWAYYQAKNTRSQMYAADAKLAQLAGASAEGLAAAWTTRAAGEKQQADEIRGANEKLDDETQGAARRATRFDGAEVFLEIAIVLCSISLLTGSMRYWQVSFAAAALGIVMAALGWLRH